MADELLFTDSEIDALLRLPTSAPATEPEKKYDLGAPDQELFSDAEIDQLLTINQEDPGFFRVDEQESVRNVFGVAGEESLRTIGINIGADLLFEDAIEENIGGIGRETNTLPSAVSSGLGQAAGDIATVGAFTLAGSAIPVVGSAAGAATGAGVVTIQGTRRELQSVWEETRSRGGTKGEALAATVKATPGTVLGEALDIVVLGKFIPKKARRNIVGAGIDAAGEAVEGALSRLGIIRRTVRNVASGAVIEGTGEVIQGASQQAAIESSLPGGQGFVPELGQAFTEPERLQEAAVGTIVGGTVRGVGGEVENFLDGAETIEAIAKNDPAPVEDIQAAKIMRAEVDLKDPDTGTASQVIPASEVSPEVLTELYKNDPDIRAEVSDDGNTTTLTKESDPESQIQDTAKQFDEQIGANESTANQLDAEINEANQEIQNELQKTTVPGEQRDLFSDPEMLRQPGTEIESTTEVKSPQAIEAEQIDFLAQELSTAPPKVAQSTAGAASIDLFKEQTVARRFREDPTLDPSVGQVFLPNEVTGESGFQYITISNESSRNEIQAAIKQRGLRGSIDTFIRESDRLELRQHSAMGVELTKELNTQLREARKAVTENPDDTQAQQKVESLTQDLESIATALVDFGTDSGQAVQYLSQLQPQLDTGQDVLTMYEAMHKKVQEKAGIKPENIKPLSPKGRRKIIEIGDAIVKLPTGTSDKPGQSTVISRELTNKANQVLASENINTMNLLEAYWYANVLSGPSTQAINLAGNGTNLFLRALGVGTTNPQAMADLLRGVTDGMRQGVVEARGALSGQDITRTMEKMNAPGALAAYMQKSELETQPYEWVQNWYRNARFNAAFLGDLVFRALAAGDAFFYTTAKQMYAQAIARQIASDTKNQDKSNAELADMLHDQTKEQETNISFEDAYRQAQEEVSEVRSSGEGDTSILNQINFDLLTTRRAFEIMNQATGEVDIEAKRFGELTTFSQTPEGFMGVVVRATNALINNVTINTRIAGKARPLKFLVPFTNIVGNVASLGLDFTPVGFARAGLGKNIVGTRGPQFSLLERQQRFGTAILGTVSAALLYAMTEPEEEDDEQTVEQPYIQIHGNGPRNFLKRRQKMETGWQPFSVQIGDRYFKYNELPMGIMWSAIGNVHDKIRYPREGQDLNGIDTVGELLQAFSQPMLESGFLTSVQNALEVANGNRKASSLFGGIARGFIPGQGFVRDAGQAIDPTLKDTRQNMVSYLLSGVPMTESLGAKPMLNTFGEPVEVPRESGVPLLDPMINRFFRQAPNDPVINFIADRQLSLPAIGPRQTISFPGARDADKADLEYIKKHRVKTLERIGLAKHLTPHEYYEFVKLQGEELRPAITEIMELVEAKEKRTKGPVPKDLIQAEIDKATREVRKNAKIKLIKKLYADLLEGGDAILEEGE